MSKQKTIRDVVSYSGTGLHTGNRTTVTFKPALPDSGVVFVRTDVPGRPTIKADIDHVVDVSRGTTLGVNGVKVLTVEHVLAAVAGLQIDNLIIEVDANEPPVGDGSSLPFVDTLLKAGIVEQDQDKRTVEIKEAVMYNSIDGDVTLAVLPCDEFRLSFTIDYNHPALGVQYRSLAVSAESFAREIAAARTFCFLHEVEALQKKGLIKGGSLENAIVIGDEEILNDSLRFPDEFVRHKLLDLLGDLSLLGAPIKGHVIAIKSGHPSHVKLAEKIRKSINGSGEKTSLLRGFGDAKDKEISLDITEIREILPHRYPFLLIDRITSLVPEKWGIGIKNVTANELFFQGHWPDNPVMPGVLLVEAMAQVGGVVILSRPERRGKVPWFMAVDKAKFRRPVFPGDQVRIEVHVLKLRARVGKIRGTAVVDGQVAAEADLHFYLADKDKVRRRKSRDVAEGGFGELPTES